MSVKVTTRVWEIDLPTSEKMVLLVLADHANDDGSGAWPSKATIARKTSLSPRSVQYHLAKLRSAGLIRVEKEATQHRPTEYAVLVRGADIAPLGDGRGATDDTRGATDDIQGSNGLPPNRPEPSNESYAHDFDEAWARYPRKVARKAALKAYVARRREGVPASDLLLAVAGYAKATSGTEQRFIKQGSTFFGPDEHWKDFKNGQVANAPPSEPCPFHGPDQGCRKAGDWWDCPDSAVDIHPTTTLAEANRLHDGS